MSEAVTNLIGHIYEATLEPSLWPRVLEDLSALTKARGAHFLLFNADNSVALGHIGKLPLECHERYAERYAVLDPRTQRAAHWPDQVLWRDETLMTTEELARSPTHQELFPAFDIHRAIGIKNRQVGGGWFTAVITSWPGHPGFSSEELDLFETLYPHLERAARIRLAVEDVDPIAQSALETIEHLDVGFVVCDRRGRVIYANRHADETLRRAESLKTTAGVLTSDITSESAVLGKMIHAACVEGLGADCTITCSDSRPIAICIMPVKALLPSHLSAPLAAVLFRDPSAATTPPPHIIRKMYNLTPGETNLLCHLIRGASLESYSTQYSKSIHTSRTLLKRALDKIDSHRQSHAISTILHSLPPLSM